MRSHYSKRSRRLQLSATNPGPVCGGGGAVAGALLLARLFPLFSVVAQRERMPPSVNLCLVARSNRAAVQAASRP